MTTFSYFLTFNIALIAAVASPGPAFIVAVRTTLTDGVSGGLRIGLGLALMAAAWTLVALLGLESVFLLFPWGYAATKIIGAVYLFYVAVSLWRSAPRSLAELPPSQRSPFIRGLLVNLSNPKSVLFAAAVLLVIFPEDMSVWQQGLVVVNHFFVELLFYFTLARVFSTPTLTSAYKRQKVKIDRLAAFVLGALAARIMLED